MSSRLLGLGRRVTAPVQPVHKQPAAGKAPFPASLLDISSAPYHPPPTLDPSAAPFPLGSPSKSPADSDAASPYTPASPSHRGGRLNDLLSTSRARSTSAVSRPGHAKQPSTSSSACSSASSSSASPTADDFDADALPSPPSSIPRALLKQGPLRKRSPRGLRLWQSRYLWLYSDALHYGKSQDGRTLQGRIPLLHIKFAHVLPAPRRLDVVVGDESIQRTFHFEAPSPADADDWARLITQAVRACAGEPSPLPPLPLPKQGKADGAGLGSRLSTTSYAPAYATPSLTPAPLPPSPSPFSAPRDGAPPRWPDFPAGEVLNLSSALEVLLPLPLHRLTRVFLCRETSRLEVHHLLHAVPRQHPQFSAIRTAHRRMGRLQLSGVLTALAWGETADAAYAVYTPALRPCDLLLHYLHAHRRLPEPVVRHVAVHCIRALAGLHACGYHYRGLSPIALAFDGDGGVVLIDPLFSVPHTAHDDGVDAEYQLPGGREEGEGAAADWWRLGVLLYELAVGLPPVRVRAEAGDAWADVGAQLRSFHPQTLPFPPFVSSPLQSLIRRLLTPDPSARLGCGDGGDATDLRSHPFFADVGDWEVDPTPPPWVRQHVQRQPVRASLGAAPRTPTPPSLEKAGRQMSQSNVRHHRLLLLAHRHATRS